MTVSSSDGVCNIEQTFRINVLNINEQSMPPSLHPMNPSISEHAPLGSFVGEISSYDPDRKKGFEASFADCINSIPFDVTHSMLCENPIVSAHLFLVHALSIFPI